MLRLFKRPTPRAPRVRTEREKRMSAASDMLVSAKEIPASDLMLVVYTIIADKQPPREAIMLLILRLQSMLGDK